MGTVTLHCCDDREGWIPLRLASSMSPHLMTSSTSALSGFTPKELRKLRSMKNPYGIQKFLDDMPYHLEDTAWSPRKVLAEESSHCLEGAIFAAAALRANGYPPLLLDFEAEHDTDHVIAIYREDGCWGAVAKSNYTGCRWREPVYRTLRELALSYFNAYFNLRRERTLRRYSVPVNLKRFDRQNWMTTDATGVVHRLSPVRHQTLFADDEGAGEAAASRGRAAVSGGVFGESV